MTATVAEEPGVEPRRPVVITVLGVTQILAWGSSYYLLAVLAPGVATDTGWPLPLVVGGLTLGLLTAGLASPRVGRLIEHHGGRPVLAASAALFATGLTLLALATSLPAYLAGWLVLGLAMGAGLYDAAFATLGRLYGQGARQAITALTLFGGFASTICWPFSAWLDATMGWRGTCLVYAALHLAVALPLYVTLVPRLRRVGPAVSQPVSGADIASIPRVRPPPMQFVLLALTITLGSSVSAVLSVHLLTMLQDLGLTMAASVALGAMVGPAQVGARAVEMAIGRHHHPIWTMIAATILVAAGIGLLWSGLPLVPVALLLYGAGIGIESIARGTLPLALFGAAGYATVMGRLALPSLLAQAGAPAIGVVLMQVIGVQATLTVVLVVAVADVAMVAALFMRSRPALAERRQASHKTS